MWIFRIPQEKKIRFVPESTKLFFFIFSAVLESTDKQLKHCIAQTCSKTDNFAESATKYVQLRICFTFDESGTTTYICSLWNSLSRQIVRCRYLYAESTRNRKWNPLTFWNKFLDLSLESRNIQTQNCLPIQCRLWPRIETTRSYTHQWSFRSIFTWSQIVFVCTKIDKT